MPLKIYRIEAENLHLEKRDLNIFKKAKIKLSDPSHY